MTTANIPATARKTRSRWLSQWSLRGLLVLVTLAAIFFGWLRIEMAKEERRRELTAGSVRDIQIGVDTAGRKAASPRSWKRRLAAWVAGTPLVPPATTMFLGEGHDPAVAIEALQLFPEADDVVIRCRGQLNPELARALRGRFDGDNDTFSIHLWSGDINLLAQTCAHHDLAVKAISSDKEQWTRAGCEAAAKLRNLKEIRLTDVDDATIALFRGHPRLQFISISRSPKVGDESAKSLACCSHLAQVKLDGVTMGREGLSALGAWPGVHFEWKNAPLSVVGFQEFVKDAGSHLGAVALENAEVEDAHLQDLFRCNTLLDVQIAGGNFKRERLDELARLPLRSLALRDCVVDGSPLNDAALAPLVKLAVPLRSIDLDGSDVTDAGIAAIATSPQLFELSLRRTKITSKTIDSLTALGSLQVLRLGGDTFDASWMPGLAKLPALSHLTLSGPRVDDAVLQVTPLNARTSLILDRTRVTKECLHELVKWPKLRSVSLAYDVGTQPGFTLDDVRAFRKETGAKIYAGWEELMEDPMPDSKRLRISISQPGYRP